VLTDEQPRALRLLRFTSGLREALWRLVQQGIAELGFDVVADSEEDFTPLERTAAPGVRQAPERGERKERQGSRRRQDEPRNGSASVGYPAGRRFGRLAHPEGARVHDREHLVPVADRGRPPVRADAEPKLVETPIAPEFVQVDAAGRPRDRVERGMNGCSPAPS
jgi:hypothetical protein